MPQARKPFSLGQCLQVRRTCLGLRLRQADRLVSQRYDDALRPFGLKGTQFTLLVALRALQPAAMSRVAEELALDRTTLNRNLALLEQAGWAESRPGADRRERQLSVTPRGEALLAEAFPAWEVVQVDLRRLAGGPAIERLSAGLEELAVHLA